MSGRLDLSTPWTQEALAPDERAAFEARIPDGYVVAVTSRSDHRGYWAHILDVSGPVVEQLVPKFPARWMHRDIRDTIDAAIAWINDRKYDDRLKDYVEVKERVRLFYEAHPDGRLVTDRVEIWQDDGVARIVVKALAYRTPDDPLPGVGWSWMVLPGTTPYTRGSEIENTETSAWGRAIGALNIGIDRSIASGDEVRAKAGEDAREQEPDSLRDGLIGTVEVGKPPVDLNLRQTPDGAAWGFKLKNGRKSYQVLAIGELADAIGLALVGEDSLAGTRVQVWGPIEMVPWQKDGRDMPPYPRLNLARIETPHWTLPAPAGATETPVPAVEAPSIPMLLDEGERAAVGGGLPDA